MFFGDQREDTRALFFSSWEKYQQQKPLNTLEQQLVDVMCAHPEYHDVLTQGRVMLAQNYFPEFGETNPFLHMGLHLAIREQVTTDRPCGMRAIYQKLLQKISDPWEVDHLIMDKLAECLWHAQRHQQAPDDVSYLQSCRELIQS